MFDCTYLHVCADGDYNKTFFTTGRKSKHDTCGSWHCNGTDKDTSLVLDPWGRHTYTYACTYIIPLQKYFWIYKHMPSLKI